jgi:hypothetical protein
MTLELLPKTIQHLEKHKVVAHMRGIMVKNSPYFATIVTGPISAKVTRIYGSKSSMLAGSSVGLTIEARDAFDNRIKEGGGNVSQSLLLSLALPCRLPPVVPPPRLLTIGMCLNVMISISSAL